MQLRKNTELLVKLLTDEQPSNSKRTQHRRQWRAINQLHFDSQFIAAERLNQNFVVRTPCFTLEIGAKGSGYFRAADRLALGEGFATCLAANEQQNEDPNEHPGCVATSHSNSRDSSKKNLGGGPHSRRYLIHNADNSFVQRDTNWYVRLFRTSRRIL